MAQIDLPLSAFIISNNFWLQAKVKALSILCVISSEILLVFDTNQSRMLENKFGSLSARDILKEILDS